MKYLRKIMAVLCVLTLVIGLAACGNTKETSENTDAKSAEATVGADNKAEPTAEPALAETKVQDTTYPITVTDTNGTEITFDSEPRKVVSLAPNITETIYQLGLGSKLVGRTDYCDYPAEVLNVESVGTLKDPDIEKIISLNPDVVIASTHFSEDSEQKLTDLGVKVVVLYEEFDIKGVYSIIETMGTIFNVNQTASEAVNHMKNSIAETKAAITGLAAPSVYYVVSYGEYGDYTAGGDTFVGQLLSLAGGDNIAKDVSGWSYTLESLMEADPDIIIISSDMKEDFEKEDHYKELSAVKAGQVYGIDNDLVDRQGFRNAEGIRTLAEIMHPEAFQ